MARREIHNLAGDSAAGKSPVSLRAYFSGGLHPARCISNQAADAENTLSHGVGGDPMDCHPGRLAVCRGLPCSGGGRHPLQRRGAVPRDAESGLPERPSQLFLEPRLSVQGFLRGKTTEDPPMSDDKTKTGKPDRDRINVNEDYELRDWSQKFGITAERLKEAVAKVGPMAADVRKHLGK